jgi:hypothetical protein
MTLMKYIVVVLAFSLLQDIGQPQNPSDNSGATPAGRMLREYLTRMALEQLAARRQKVAQITSRAAFEPRRKKFREDMLRMMGGLPETRTPLNVSITGTLERCDYRVEKLIF